MKHFVLAFLFYGSFFAPTNAASPLPDKPSLNAAFACTVTVSSPTNGIICAGAASATLTANPAGGTAPYTYVWKRGVTIVGGNTKDLAVTQVGNYTVTISSAGDCAATSANFEVKNSTLAPGTITGNNQICTGGTTTLTANPSGSSGYTYQWKRGATNVGTNSPTFVADQTSVYTVVITDVNTCSVTSSPFTVTPTTLSATVSGGNILCAGGSTTLTANPTPATPNNGTYMYLWKRDGTDIQGATGKTYPATLPATYTVVVSRSDGACSVTSAPGFTVSASTLTASLSGATNALCAGAPGNTRTLTAASTGGAGTKTYRFYLNGNPVGAASTTTTYNATAAGSYTVLVKDDNCEILSAAIVLSLSTLSAGVITGGNTICPGSSTELTANPAAGTGPYTYQWKQNTVNSPGATNQKFLVAAAGDYTVVVTDANGCQVTSGVFAVTVSNPTVSISGAAVYCQGSSTNLTAAPVGGTGPYSFQWKLGATNVGTSAAVLVANQPGSYTVVVTDSRGCSATSNALTLTENPRPTANAGPGASLTGNETYSLSGVTTASGGTGPYTYSWSATPGVAISPNATTAQPVFGPFNQNTSITLTVTDSKGCTATSTAAVTFAACPLAVVAAISVGTDVICAGGSTTLSATVTGSSGTVMYQWQQTDTNIPGATATTFQTSAGGNYRLRVTDGRGCTAFSNVIVVSLSSLSATAVASSDVICAGGSVTLTANPVGNNGATTYQWQKEGVNIAGATGNTYQTNAGGSYRVIVTDSKGCTATSAAMVLTNSALTLSAAASSPVACPASPATLTATVTGNNGTIRYQWQKDNTNVGANSATYQATDGGNYRVIVTDSKGCQLTSPIIVLSNSSLTVSAAASTDVICVGGSSTLTATPTGGTGAVTYQWRNNGSPITGATSSTYATNTAGSFSVVINDGRGCPATSNAVSISTTTLSVNAVASTDIICAGATVTFTANPTGNNGATTYQWQKDNANIGGATGSTYQTNAGGSYRVIVTDGKGCSATSNAVVVSNSALSVTATASTDLICPGATATFSANVTGNAGGVNFQWQKNGGNAGSGTPFTTGDGGSYRVIATDSKGCQATSNAVEVSNSTLSVGITGRDFYCEGGSSPFVQLRANPSGGSGGFGYQWRKDGQPIASQIGATVDIAAGNYTVEVSDSRGCRVTSPTATVRALKRPIANAGPGGEIVGPDVYDLAKLAVTTASGGTPGYTFQWSANPVVRITPRDTDAQPAFGPFTRDATVFLVVTDAAGCKSDTAKAPLKYFPCNLTNKIAGTNYVCTNGQSALTANAAAGYGDPKTYKYQWRVNGNLLPNTTDSLRIQATRGGLYTVMATDNKGCRRTDTLQLAELASPLVSITGASSICKGTTTTLNAVVIGGQPKFTYQWKNEATVLPVDSVRLSTAVGGTFTLRVTDSKGCVGASQAFTLTARGTELSVAISPAGPTTVFAPNTVTLNGTSSGGTTLQWQKNGQDIPGANALTYVVKEPGQADYALAVGSSDGCLFPSQPITVNIILPTSVAPALAGNLTVRAFPNPTNGRLVVEVSLQTAQPLALHLTNLSGRTVTNYQTSQRNTRHVAELDLSEQPDGLYLLRLEAGGQHAVQKVVKTN